MLRLLLDRQALLGGCASENSRHERLVFGRGVLESEVTLVTATTAADAVVGAVLRFATLDSLIDAAGSTARVAQVVAIVVVWIVAILIGICGVGNSPLRTTHRKMVAIAAYAGYLTRQSKIPRKDMENYISLP